MKALILKSRRLLILTSYAAIFAFALVTAFLLRFEFALPAAVLPYVWTGVWLALASKLVVFVWARLDRGWWRFLSLADVVTVFLANAGGSSAFVVATLVVIGPSFPRTIYIIDFLLCFLLTSCARFAVRLYYESVRYELNASGCKGILIYGAGAAGAKLARELRSDRAAKYQVVGFLDDDPKKWNARLFGSRVLGPGRAAARLVEAHKRRVVKIEEIVLAMPSASALQLREAFANCRAAGVPCKTIPTVTELLTGEVLSGPLRTPSLSDLVGREPVGLEEDRIRAAIAGRSILVTGGAGSIGSELCRQIAGFQPRVLVIFDQAESELYRIDLELRDKCPSVHVVAEIGDIRDYDRVSACIAQHSVQAIFHAAAYKHVPLMEAHILEAVKNNVLGTWNLTQAAVRQGVSKFVLISSDKAVNPTSVMGLTKRICELIVSSYPAQGPTQFVAVRFGNVLGSNGSVVPLFQAQIAAGGPVTVTHPDMRRYFMSVREAVQLVLQASTMGKGSEIFVLDMGEPVRILDVARNLIRLAGLEPDEDIEIRFVGLRPGEKLFEELVTHGEDIIPTHHRKILIFAGSSQPGFSLMQAAMARLGAAAAQRNVAAAIQQLADLAPEYQPMKGQRSADRELELKTAAS